LLVYGPLLLELSETPGTLEVRQNLLVSDPGRLPRALFDTPAGDA
jgi:hypothetical protein